MIAVNPARSSARDREALSTFVDSAAWMDFVRTADEDILRPLRAKVLKDPELDPREQTGVVRALQQVQKLIESPYKKLAEASGKKIEEVMPAEVRRLFT